MRAGRLLTQLVLALVAPTLLVGLLIGVPLAESRRSALLSQEQRRATQAAEAATLLFRERLQAGEQLVGLLADRGLLHDLLLSGDRARAEALLAEARADTLLDCLALLDVRGAALIQSGSCVAPPRGAAGVTLHAVVGAGLTAQVGAPLLHEGRPAGWLLGELPIDRSLVDAARRQPDLEIGIVVDQVLVSSSLPDRAGLTIQPRPLDQPAEIVIQGQPYLAHYAPLTDLSGSGVAFAEVLLPLARVRAAQLSVTVIVLAGTAAAILVAAALGWLMARRITRPIGQLGAAAAAIGGGDLARTVAVQGPAEILQLSAAIDQMRAQLARSREAIENEKQRYVDILESIAEAVITLDASGRITAMNHGAERMLGCDRQLAAGSSLAALITPADGGELPIRSLPRHGSIRIAARTAQQVALTISASCAPQPGGDGSILVLRDVSEDAAVRQLKDAFLANITHELRTPLAAQIASLEILREEDEALTPAERSHILEALHSGVRRLDLLVHNLLDSASIEAGYFRVDPEPCRLEPLVDDAIALVQPLAHQRSQRIVTELDARLPELYADGRRVVQVLINLLANASKFGPVGDTIIVRARCDAAGGMVRLSVSDHGPGMPPERRDRLFERFLRPGADTLQAQGAGLGLAIVKAIVDRHGGTVHVDAGLAQGTTIAIALPSVRGGGREDLAGR